MPRNAVCSLLERLDVLRVHPDRNYSPSALQMALAGHS